MTILVKFPSRERPHKFFLCISEYVTLSHGENVRYLITLDKNDPTINSYISYCEKLKERGVKIEWVIGENKSKIDAVNRDMDGLDPWDILVLASDDMICQVQNWDVILRNEMEEYYPDTDGALFHSDGDPATARHNNGQGLCTMCILGKKYYDRYGYIYHPDYVSLWCDNEYTDVAQQLGKMTKFEQVLFKHKHYSNDATIPKDALMTKTQSFYHRDEQVYHKRKAINFGI